MIHIHVWNMKPKFSPCQYFVGWYTERNCLIPSERSFVKTMVQIIDILLFVVITLTPNYTGIHNTWSNVNFSQFRISFVHVFPQLLFVTYWRFIATSVWDKIGNSWRTMWLILWKSFRMKGLDAVWSRYIIWITVCY